MSKATRRTVRTNLRFLARRAHNVTPPAPLCRDRAKAPYSPVELAAYLALADALRHSFARARANALICLGAGAGLIGSELRRVRGSDVVSRSGGLLVWSQRTPSPRRAGALQLSRPPASRGRLLWHRLPRLGEEP